MNIFPAVNLMGRLHRSRNIMMNMLDLRSLFIHGPSKAAFAKSMLCKNTILITEFTTLDLLEYKYSTAKYHYFYILHKLKKKVSILGFSYIISYYFQ